MARLIRGRSWSTTSRRTDRIGADWFSDNDNDDTDDDADAAEEKDDDEDDEEDDEDEDDAESIALSAIRSPE